MALSRIEIGLKLLLKSCDEENVPLFRCLFVTIPWDELTAENRLNFIVEMMEISTAKNHAKIVKEILKGFDESDPNQGRILLITDLFLSNKTDVKLMEKIVRLDPVWSFLEIGGDIIRRPNELKIQEGLWKLFEVFRIQNETQIRQLINIGIKEENELAVNVLETMLEEVTSLKERPVHVYNFLGLGELSVTEDLLEIPLTRENYDKLKVVERREIGLPEQADLIQIADERSKVELNFVTPPLEAMVDLMAQFIDEKQLSPDEIESTRDRIREELQFKSSEEKRGIILPYFDSKAQHDLYLNVSLFRLLGPAHPVTGSDLTSHETPCTKYGGCRMLICNCTENYDDDAEAEDPWYDWFFEASKTCNYCHKKLENRSHAVRTPLEDGGWNGCYCSWECVTNDRDCSPMIHKIINMVDPLLQVVGIQDRKE